MNPLPLALLLASGLASSAGAIDLTPRYISTKTEGVIIERPYFADGATKYGIKLDSETKLTPFEGGALFRFDRFPEALVRLRTSPMPAETGFALTAFERYQQAARTLLPAEATGVQFVESALDSFPINGWSSLRITFSYQMRSAGRRQSITFINLKPTEQVVLQTAASEKNFQEVSARAFNIIRRWHEIDPADTELFN